MHHLPYPAKAIIVARGERLTDVAAAVECNPGTFGRAINRHAEPWPALRRRVAEYLGLPEEVAWGAWDSHGLTAMSEVDLAAALAQSLRNAPPRLRTRAVL